MARFTNSAAARWGGIKDPSDVFIKFGKEEGAAKIQKLLERAEEIDLAKPDVIPESIKGAPVNLRQPEGWIYSDKGISHIDEKTYGPVMVCRTPIILTQRLRSLETGEEKIESHSRETMSGTEQSTHDQRSSQPEVSQSWQTLDAQ